MAENIKGVKKVCEVDPDIFASLEGLHSPGANSYNIFSPALLSLHPLRSAAARRLIQPLFKEAYGGLIAMPKWALVSGLVRPGHTLRTDSQSWHNDGANFWLTTNHLPAELLCVELADGQMSCREDDIKANKPLWEVTVNKTTGSQDLQEFGGQIATLDAGVLYLLHDYAIHRGVNNNTGATVEKTTIAFSPT